MIVKEMKILAKKMVSHSLGIKNGQKVYIDVLGRPSSFVEYLVRSIYEEGGKPFVKETDFSSYRALIEGGDKVHFEQLANYEVSKINAMDAYISIRADENIYELSNIDEKKYQVFLENYIFPIQMAMASLDKWLLIKWPTAGMAQLAKMNTNSFNELFFKSCTFDYKKMAEKVKPLKERLENADQVRIVSPNTDLRFSIKGMSSFVCDGRYNLPDGEIFTAPILDSVNGKIKFNVPASLMGMNFDDINLEFENGQIIHASCNNMGQLLKLIEKDRGSKQIGEFGIGLNTNIKHTTNSLIFDEKMSGSIHLALGQAYEMADNGNKSSIHLDMVLNQSLEQGGGELYFDNELIRKDGLFVPSDLVDLNNLGCD
ncbi:aminopeptidase [Cytobacillus pseudoceanisediminis]|uniref:aminopeptidase n=1 Tax=Cytobacillus pseudoceanisediminis TaxID=3051614 RepID=UPI003C2C4B9F